MEILRIVCGCLLGCMGLVSCSSFRLLADMEKIGQIEQGMSQTEVAARLGEPNYKRFDESGRAQWEFVYPGNSMTVLIDFYDGKVVALDTFSSPSVEPPSYANLPPAPVGNRPPSLVLVPMNNHEFNRFYREMKSALFHDDRLDLLKEAALSRKFTCRQCLRLFDFCNFDDERMEYLRILSPRIYDYRDCDKVVDAFVSLFKQDEARRLLGMERGHGW